MQKTKENESRYKKETQCKKKKKKKNRKHQSIKNVLYTNNNNLMIGNRIYKKQIKCTGTKECQKKKKN